MVSVIVPAYNAASYLRECLDSALAQTCHDIEVIVVDDGSTDSTPEIIAEYELRDPRVRHICQSNKGPSEARNAAIMTAEGDWITFLDSDDLLAPDCVEVLVTVADSTGCGLVYAGWSRLTDPSGFSEIKSRKGHVRIMPAEEVVSDVLYQTSFLVPAPWAKLYRRELFDAVHFRQGITYEDLDMFYELAFAAGRVAVTDTPVYYYRDNPTSITNTFTPSRFDVLAVTERLETYMSDHCPALLPAARDRRLSANFNMYCLLATYDKEDRYASVAKGCMDVIKSHRRGSLTDRHVRLKNKLAVLLSMLGVGVLRRVSPLVYGRKTK